MPAAKVPPKATPQAVRAIFETFRKAEPHPKTELVYHTPYQLLVSVVLSAQATDKSVNTATAPLYTSVSTPQNMLSLGEDRLLAAIKTIGLYRTKARNVMALSRILVEQYGGQLPETMEELVKLPGVGRKTANVVLNQLFNHPTIAVDTHVFRVSHRLGLSRGTTPEAVEADLMAEIPDEFKAHAHHWLILHGRYICVARSPKCATCSVEKWCHSPDKTWSSKDNSKA
jgi:endonuclease-3